MDRTQGNPIQHFHRKRTNLYTCYANSVDVIIIIIPIANSYFFYSNSRPRKAHTHAQKRTRHLVKCYIFFYILPDRL